jgi:hypothetical protein
VRVRLALGELQPVGVRETFMTTLEIPLTALGLFTGMLCLTELGRWIGRIRNQKKSEESGGSFAVLEGGVFGLMGLLVALTFSASASRLEIKRQSLVDETNAIGTAWGRIALLPEARQGDMRHHFMQYVDTRLAFFRNIPNLDAAADALVRTNTLQGEIWSQAVVACGETSSVAATILFLPALNTMIDLATTRTMLTKTHLPVVIRALLVLSPLLCAFLAGIESAPLVRRAWMPSILFALMLSLTVYVILDLDYPRVGLISIDQFDEALIELRANMENSR